MKNIILSLIILLAASSCKKDQTTIPAAQLQNDAYIENNLAVDGCDWIIRIDTSSYAPSAKSTIIIESFAKDNSNNLKEKIHIQYYLTGKKKSVICGWGTEKQLDEIVLLSILKK